MAFPPELPTYNQSTEAGNFVPVGDHTDEFALPPPPSWDSSLNSVDAGNFLCVEDYLVDGGGGDSDRFPSLGEGGNETARLPPGIKFRPTDEELVVHYLQLEFLHAAPKGPITHADIYNYQPDQLSGLVEEDHGNGKMYFYTRIKKMGQSKTDRSISSKKGFWRVTQAPKPIRGSSTGNTIAYKTPLAYFHDKKKTQWLMHEYRLPHTSHLSAEEDLVLAVVYFFRRKTRDNEDDSHHDY